MTSIRLPSRSGLRYRLAQGIGAVRPRTAPDADDTLRAILTPDQVAAFKRLSAHDQRHSLRVLALVTMPEGATPASSNLRTAALLHDVGKAMPNGRVRLPDRVLRVILGRLSPCLWARLSRPPARGWRTGMVLAEHHPAIGASEAARLGCTFRTCWLIEHHGGASAAGDLELRRLIAADHAAR